MAIANWVLLLALAVVVVVIDCADAVVLMVAIRVLRDVVDDVNASVEARDARMQTRAMSRKDWFDLHGLYCRSLRW